MQQSIFQQVETSFRKLLPIIPNTLVDRKDIDRLMKQCSEEKGLISQPQKMTTSSLKLQNGTLITPLLLFYFELGLIRAKIRRFVEFTPKKIFKNFIQSAVFARRRGDENPNSSRVVETMKLLANRSYDYQILDSSGRTVTKYLNDEKMHSAISSKFFKKLDHVK